MMSAPCGHRYHKGSDVLYVAPSFFARQAFVDCWFHTRKKPPQEELPFFCAVCKGLDISDIKKLQHVYDRGSERSTTLFVGILVDQNYLAPRLVMCWRVPCCYNSVCFLHLVFSSSPTLKPSHSIAKYSSGHKRSPASHLCSS